ncbi:MAG: hypothetical protein DRN61_05170 [Thaumarchaeota archaeon]|nr:MAG: hypothetical protein DRN61_05170 [Nitrososphaerota archaeon]
MHMGSVGVYIRVNKDLLDRLTKVARALGMSRSEANRKAMEMFMASTMKESMTSGMRGLVKSRLTLKELDEIYMVTR